MTKKIVIIFLALFILIKAPVFAAPSKNSIEVFIDDKKVISDVMPFIYKDTTMVPLRVISENLGVKVNYESVSKKITLSFKNNTIILKVNELYAYVGGKKAKLQIPPMIISNRVFVPLRFIAENFEAKVIWDGQNRIVRIYKKNNEIKNIYWDENEGVLNIEAENPVEYSIQEKENSIILDLTAKVKENQNFYVYNGKFLKDAQLSFTDMGTRLILEKKEGFIYEHFVKDGVLKLKFFTIIDELEYAKSTESSKFTIKVPANTEFKYFTLGSVNSNDYRLVLDLYNSRPAFNIPRIDGDNFVRSIRSSQFSINPDITRIVFDIKRDFNFLVEKEEEGLIVEFRSNAKLLDVSIENKEGKTQIIFGLDKTTAYSINEDVLRNTLVIEMDKTNLIYGGKTLDFTFSNGMKGNVIFEEDVNNNKLVARIYKGDYGLHHNVLTLDNKIIIEFSSLSLFGKTIVIDPGHGGSDPGAVYQGVYEKDINLDIALRLKKVLEDNGAKVLMTRESDIYVNLYARAGMANEINADLFVSIHCNSSLNPQTSGVQTLYFPTMEKKRFAEVIQKSMVEALGITDLGIVERTALVVIRETNMPSCIIEVAFMSNPKDLSLLMDPNFRQKAAEGIFKGILRFLLY
ncbi:N-acetylmuramoyl-L-alanine amidase [Thermovenabulum sp.]|uniref:N-acetylmuramoyl-L-alanine amidase n=1 Tax=Thermovenabulum sp. TaxID=3100335 RepID=UPI003C7BC42A